MVSVSTCQVVALVFLIQRRCKYAHDVDCDRVTNL